MDVVCRHTHRQNIHTHTNKLKKVKKKKDIGERNRASEFSEIVPERGWGDFRTVRSHLALL